VGNRKLENGAKSHKEMNFRLGGKIELSLVRFRRPYKYNCQSLKAYLVRDQRYDLSSSFCTFLSCKLFIYIYIYIPISASGITQLLSIMISYHIYLKPIRMNGPITIFFAFQ
jgi:hypothetical protein